MVAIFIPTLYRAHNLPRLIDSLNRTGDFTPYLMFPCDDADTLNFARDNRISYWCDQGDMRYVKRIQFMYENTTEPWFLTGSDDIVFHPGWYEAAQPYMETNTVISFEDLCNPNVPGTNFLISRKYIETLSGVFDAPNTVLHQGYYHNFCDNELVGTARKRGMFFKCSGIIEHFHHTVGKAANDMIYEMAQANFHNDAALCHSREHLWS